MPLRHAAPSPPQVLDSLHRLAKVQSRRPLDSYLGTLIKTASESIEATLRRRRIPFCWICGTHGIYETAEVRDFRRIGGGRGLCGGPGKRRVNGVFLGRPQSFRDQRRPVDDCSPGRGEWRRTAEQGAEHFIAKWIAVEEVRAKLRHKVVCSNVTGRA